jgi:hypothetical protein
MSQIPTQLSEKERLEIQKLRLEVRYIRRTFFAQLFNTLTLLAIGIGVLFFYQWPQIGQMEATRLSSERIQVGTMVVAAQALENVQERNKIIETLAKQWPQYEFIRDIAAGNAVIAQAATPKAPNAVQPERCDALADELGKLQRTATLLNNRISAELQTARDAESRRKGEATFFDRLFGQTTPAAQAMMQQRTEILELIKAVKQRQTSAHC